MRSKSKGIEVNRVKAVLYQKNWISRITYRYWIGRITDWICIITGIQNVVGFRLVLFILPSGREVELFEAFRGVLSERGIRTNN